MSCIPKTEKLIDLVESFREGELLLPDFQRKYTWKPKDDMRALLASFILDYPIGTFLIGEAESTSFRAREPECFDSLQYIKTVSKKFKLNQKETLSESIESSEGYPSYFLYDGQQRMTTIEMLFGDGYFSSPLDKKYRPRWFLNLNNFGLKSLDWPDDLYDISFDELCNDESGNSYIVCIEYGKNSSKSSALHPSNREEKILVDYCINDNENGYLFPLDSLFDDSIDVVKTNILSMSVNDILTKTDRYNDLKKKNLSEDELDLECEDIKKDIKKWIAQFSKLLNRIRDFQVPVIRIKSDSLARVAGIFEVVNKQGVDLKTFDLLLARSIKPNEETIRDTLQNVISESYQAIDDCWDIGKMFVNARMKGSRWDPGQFFGGAKDKINKGETLTNKLMSLYPKLLCLLARYPNIPLLQEKAPNSSFKNSTYTWSISEKEMLKTDREDICNVQRDAANRLIRASIYLKVYCGIAKFSELAYQQIILVLALVLDDTIWMKLKEDPQCKEARRIQAWYWISIFSGYYKKSQDVMVLRDCLDIRGYVNNGGELLSERAKLLFKDLGYSDEETLKNSNNKALTLFITQFEIRNGIKDFYTKQADSGEHVRGLISSFETDIEKDHIISISYYNKISNSNVERKSDHKVNSPLNKTNISSSANKRKGELSPFDYYKLDKIKADFASDEAKLLKEHLINPDVILNLDRSDIDDTLDKILSSRFSKIVESVEGVLEQAI